MIYVLVALALFGTVCLGYWRRYTTSRANESGYIKYGADDAVTKQRADWAAAMLILAMCCRLNRMLPVKERETAKKKRVVVAAGPGTPIVIEAKENVSNGVIIVSLLETAVTLAKYRLEIRSDEPGYRQVDSLLYERECTDVKDVALYTDGVYCRLYIAFKSLELVRHNLGKNGMRNPLSAAQVNNAVDGIIALLRKEKEQLQ